MQCLEEKVDDMAAVQKTILLRLANIEEIIRSQEISKGIHADQYSWQDEDAFDDSDYWQPYHSSASAFSSTLQSQRPAQLQYTQS